MSEDDRNAVAPIVSAGQRTNARIEAAEAHTIEAMLDMRPKFSRA